MLLFHLKCIGYKAKERSETVDVKIKDIFSHGEVNKIKDEAMASVVAIFADERENGMKNK